MSDSGYHHLADLDGDSYPDILAQRTIFNPGGQELFWRRNRFGDTGTMSFDETPRPLGAVNPLSILGTALADVDCDGDLDVISRRSVTQNRYYVQLNRLNESPSEFAAATQLFSSDAANTGIDALVGCDLDSDGDTDLATVLVRSGFTTILWAENKIIHSAGYTVELYPNLSGPELLPATSEIPLLAIARINGELWFRFFTGGVATTYRESERPADAASFGRLREDLEAYWGYPPDASARQLLFNQVTLVFHHRTSTAPQFELRDLYSGMLPGETTRFSPNLMRCGDMDGDGDVDLFTADVDAGGHCAWFENRLNEPGHGDFAPLHQISSPVAVGAGLADLDGNGIAEVILNSRDGILVLYNGRGLHEAGSAWAEWVAGRSPNASQDPGKIVPIDLDGDGDLELVSGASSTYGGGVMISENFAAQSGPERFNRHQTPLVTQTPVVSGFIPDLRTADRDGDGDPDLSIASGRHYRNDFSIAPDFNFPVDESLGDFPPPAAPDSVLLADFDSWQAAQPWKRTEEVLKRLTADLDGDGDADVLILQDFGAEYLTLAWFENRPEAADRFRGPLGIFGDIGSTPQPAFCDYDSDGDLDVIVMHQYGPFHNLEIVGFPNRSAADSWVLDFVDDPDGFYRNSSTLFGFSATLELSADLNWSSAEKITVPVRNLQNPHALLHSMKWRDPAFPKRFYRMVYSLDVP